MTSATVNRPRQCWALSIRWLARDWLGSFPGGLFKLLLPIWLFVRGFNLTASDRMRVGAASD